MIVERSHPAREPFDADELDDRRARLGGLGLELVGMVEVRGGEPLRHTIGIAVLAGREVVVDDGAERGIERATP